MRKVRLRLGNRLSNLPSHTSGHGQVSQAEFSLSVAPYTPRTYAGPITLFKASMQGAGYVDDPYLGWRQYAVGDIDVYTIPGYRETMLEKPRVRILARHLQACLDQVSEGEQNA